MMAVVVSSCTAEFFRAPLDATRFVCDSFRCQDFVTAACKMYTCREQTPKLKETHHLLVAATATHTFPVATTESIRWIY